MKLVILLRLFLKAAISVTRYTVQRPQEKQDLLIKFALIHNPRKQVQPLLFFNPLSQIGVNSVEW